jgi:protein-S-isoprenylcysteine O-methyltransferase Ste14
VNIISSILLLTIYFAVYGIVHSWLAGSWVKNWARQTFGQTTDRWYRLAYNIFAVVTLLPMFVLMAVLPAQTLYVVPSPWREVMVLGQLLALVLAGITVLQTGAFHFLGLTQLVSETPTQNSPLNFRGFYKWVRHPLYTFSLMFIWLTPAMTTNTLTAFILFTLYFQFGSIYEERRMVAEFGPVYEDYCRQVPRLIPVPGRRYKPVENPA